MRVVPTLYFFLPPRGPGNLQNAPPVRFALKSQITPRQPTPTPPTKNRQPAGARCRSPSGGLVWWPPVHTTAHCAHSAGCRGWRVWRGVSAFTFTLRRYTPRAISLSRAVAWVRPDNANGPHRRPAHTIHQTLGLAAQGSTPQRPHTHSVSSLNQHAPCSNHSVSLAIACSRVDHLLTTRFSASSSSHIESASTLPCLCSTHRLQPVRHHPRRPLRLLARRAHHRLGRLGHDRLEARPNLELRL